MLVADASMVLEWFLPGQSTADSMRVFDIARKGLIVVPALWIWETQSVLLKFVRQRFLTSARAMEIRLELSVISKRIEESPDDWIIERTWEIATRQMITFYDASYVELALRLGLPLASTDKGTKHAARGMGVPLL